MSYVAKPKRGRKKNWNDEALQWTPEGEFDRELTALSRESNPEFVAPGAEEKWRARNLIDIQWKLTNIDCPVSYNRILSCIVDHANPNTGACYPRHSIIAVETGYSVETVKRAIRWWKKQGFLKTESRGRGHALAYHPQWKRLENLWRGIACEIDEIKASGVTKGTYDEGERSCDVPVSEVTKGTYAEVTKGTYGGGQYGDLHNLKDITSKNELHPERVHPPSVADTQPLEDQIREKEKEGLQKKEEVERPSPRPAGPSLSETQKRAAAERRLDADLRLALGDHYCEVLEWLPVPGTVHDAAVAADIDAPNTGVVVVLDAYRKEKAA